jgi:hypothetical protein
MAGRKLAVISSPTVSATIERFSQKSDPDAIHRALARDGVVIVEDLLASDVVQRVNDEVEAAVTAADPNEEYFDPVMQAFHGLCTSRWPDRDLTHLRDRRDVPSAAPGPL